MIFDLFLYIVRLTLGSALVVAGGADAFFINSVGLEHSLVMLGVGIILMDGKK